MQKSKKEIIDETVAYYSTHPRATLSPTDCTYLNNKGDMCAHSRCLIEDFDRRNLEGVDAHSLIKKFGDEIHKLEYRGHSPEFWSNIQALHDRQVFWRHRSEVPNELTPQGVRYYETLCEKWGK